MAPGYVIALLLEVAGVAGLILGTVVLRGERRARAEELRGLLLTGNAAAAGGIRTLSSPPALRRIVVAAPVTDAAQDAFAARAALHRALARPERAAA